MFCQRKLTYNHSVSRTLERRRQIISSFYVQIVFRAHSSCYRHSTNELFNHGVIQRTKYETIIHIYFDTARHSIVLVQVPYHNIYKIFITVKARH